MSTQDQDDNWAGLRKAAFERDKHRCINCYRSLDTATTLDPDHTVPRGVGGSNRLSNIGTLCRKCHDAKHGNGTAPTVEIVSSGRMDDEEFIWFKHLLNQMIPVFARQYNVQLDARFQLDNRDVWHLPIGDLRLLDQVLSQSDDISGYASLQVEQYME